MRDGFRDGDLLRIRLNDLTGKYGPHHDLTVICFSVGLALLFFSCSVARRQPAGRFSRYHRAARQVIAATRVLSG
jgi:hypothetical protein